MNKRSVPIAVASCILALAGLAGYLVPTPTEANPTRILMENLGGRVVFTHKTHNSPGPLHAEVQCAACHHELKITVEQTAPGGQPKVLECASCHGTSDEPDFVRAHQEKYRAAGGDASCASCHHTRFTGLASGWNHEEHWSYASDDCQACHHPEKYEARPGREMNIKPQKCSNCHTAKANPMTATTLKNAVHARCQTCHAELFEQKLPACSTCHAQTPTAELVARGEAPKSYPACSTCHEPLPGRMDAFHNQCRSCHDKAGKGPGTKAPCTQCHTP